MSDNVPYITMPDGSTIKKGRKKSKGFIPELSSLSTMEREVYPYKKKSDAHKTYFYNHPDISDSNKKAVKGFITKQEALGVGDRRITKLLSNLKTILTIIYPGFTLSTATEDDLIELSKRIKQTSYKDTTKKDFHVVIRRFYKVTEGRNSHYPVKLDFFKSGRKITTTKGPDDLITRKELQALLKACINNRDKAIIMLLYEGGLRVGELANLDIKDIKLKEDGVDVHIPDKPGCKTGARDIWLTECYSHLRGWIEAHPKPQKNNPLFVSLERYGQRNTHTRLDHSSIRSMLHKKAALAGLSSDRIKKVTPHRFRHTCATEKAILGFSESQLCAFMGWKQGSNMGAVYIHMTAKGVKEAYQRALGISSKENNHVKDCFKCGYSNGFLVESCGRCGSPLNAKTRLKRMGERDRQLHFINALFTVEPELKRLAKETTNERLSEIEEIMGEII